MYYGYVRVLSEEQNVDRQLIDLRTEIERKNIFIDKQSRKNIQGTHGRFVAKYDNLFLKNIDFRVVRI